METALGEEAVSTVEKTETAGEVDRGRWRVHESGGLNRLGYRQSNVKTKGGMGSKRGYKRERVRVNVWVLQG